MFKKILFTFLAVLCVYSTGLIAYKIFEPEINDTDEYIYLDYDSLKDYTMSAGLSTNHYYMFLSKNSDDSIYVRDTVLSTVENETGLDIQKLIEFVDITELEKNLETHRLLDDWGIQTYPSFMAVSVDENGITIDNTLEWNPELPMSAANVEQWLTENGLYTGVEQTIVPAG